MRPLSFPLLALSLAACSPDAGPLVRIVNADSVTLDRVIVEAAGSEYALGRLLPGTAGQVRPAPAADSVLRVRHQSGGPFVVTVAGLDGARVVEIQLHADSAGAVEVERR